jgi:hypothetical protein
MAACLVIMAVSSEMADTAEEAADVNSATVAEFLLVILSADPVPGNFLGFLSCQSFCLLSWGELFVHRHWVMLVLDSCYCVNFFLRNDSTCTGIGSALAATTTSLTALSTTYATLDIRDIASLKGWDLRFL